MSRLSPDCFCVKYKSAQLFLRFLVRLINNSQVYILQFNMGLCPLLTSRFGSVCYVSNASFSTSKSDIQDVVVFLPTQRSTRGQDPALEYCRQIIVSPRCMFICRLSLALVTFVRFAAASAVRLYSYTNHAKGAF